MRIKLLLLLLLLSHCIHSQIITTIAGNGTVGYSGNGGPATSAQLYDPHASCADHSGNIYVTDPDNHVVRKVNSAGIISNFAGTHILGNSGDGGPATSALLGTPYGICRDNFDNTFITDPYYDVIRKVNAAGIITTIAGTGASGYSGDGGLATSAQLNSPCGICVDNDGNIYFAEFGNQVIRKINTVGIISTVAGDGSLGYFGDGGPAVDAQLNSPTGVCVDNKGNLYIADMGNSVIRIVNSSGIITTFAGGTGIGYAGDGGAASSAQLKFPYFVYSDNSGNIYISDTGNSVVRVVNSMGIISTVAGNGTSGYSGDGGPATSAALGAPGQICIDDAGNIYIPDAGPKPVIRKIGSCPLPSVITEASDQFICSAGNTSLSITANNLTGYQWQLNTGSGWNNLANDITYSGTNSNSLDIAGITVSMNNYQYRCLVNNACGNIFSSPAILTVASPTILAITIGSSSNNICQGTTVTFSANSSGAGTSPIYHWTKNGLDVGGNLRTYSEDNLNNGDIINCVVTSNNTCSSSTTATSNDIIMTVNTPVKSMVSIAPSANNICYGTPVTLTSTVTNGGSNPQYTWFKNGTNLFLNAPVYTDNSFHNGDQIICEVRPDLTCVTSAIVASNTIQMNVTPLVTPSITITTNSSAICRNSEATFDVITLNGGPLPIYQWKKNGINVGSNNSVYSDNGISEGDVISCTLTANGTCLSSSNVNSNNIRMTILPDPIVALDHANTLCAGSVKQLDAGNFKSYLWSDGSTQKTLKVSMMGTYYVTVVDNNGCTGADTTKITTILPLPAAFLAGDTSICSYGKLELKPSGFYKNYLWSTNSTNSSINISEPGVYWLQVTDANNCNGKDTVIVNLKDCMTGFYIPSAFTPNNDGKNDIFRPLLFGNVRQYKFVIYNRWGQIVFQTNEIGKGWDGTFGGLRQDPNIFVWTCTWQLDGAEIQTEKGTVMLVR